MDCARGAEPFFAPAVLLFLDGGSLKELLVLKLRVFNGSGFTTGEGE